MKIYPEEYGFIPECDKCEDCEKAECPIQGSPGPCQGCGCLDIYVDDFGRTVCRECWDNLPSVDRLKVNQAAWDERFDMGDPMCDYTDRPGGY